MAALLMTVKLRRNSGQPESTWLLPDDVSTMEPIAIQLPLSSPHLTNVVKFFKIMDWRLGTEDWGLGTGDWDLSLISLLCSLPQILYSAMHTHFHRPRPDFKALDSCPLDPLEI